MYQTYTYTMYIHIYIYIYHMSLSCLGRLMEGSFSGLIAAAFSGLAADGSLGASQARLD